MTAVATKSPARSKAKHAPSVAPTVVAPPPSPVATVAAAVAEILERVDQAYSGIDKGTICINAHTLIDIARDELQQLVNGVSVDAAGSAHRIAACVAGAHSLDLAETPTCTARHELLLQASETMESAAISFGFVEEPCEALAAGIRAGRAAAANPNQGERDDLAKEAIVLGSLLNWVIAARDTLEDIRHSAPVFPDLQSGLKQANIRCWSPSWVEEEMGFATYCILSRQRDLITKLAGGAA